MSSAARPYSLALRHGRSARPSPLQQVVGLPALMSRIICWSVLRLSVMSTSTGAERDAEGRAVPPLFGALCELGYFGDLQVREADVRRIAVGVGQMDQEESVVFFAVVAGSAEGFDLTD
ncbi:hypothetical protein ABZV67_14735 [Streptomyces sp. NPDC005065]|uniref:hypothetical protein n=1 Tax=unclassified Streptomyces TaxID=2593676 RepID=UPI0033B46C1E